MRSICPVLAIGLLLGSLSPIAFAQDATADAERSAAAERLLEVSRVREMTDQMMMQLPDMMSASIAQMPDAPPPERINDIMTVVVDAIEQKMGYDSMKDDFVGIYADAYSTEDLNGLSDFYESALGQRFLDATPQVLNASMNMAQQRMVETMPEIQALVQEEIEKRQ